MTLQVASSHPPGTVGQHQTRLQAVAYVAEADLLTSNESLYSSQASKLRSEAATRTSTNLECLGIGFASVAPSVLGCIQAKDRAMDPLMYYSWTEEHSPRPPPSTKHHFHIVHKNWNASSSAKLDLYTFLYCFSFNLRIFYTSCTRNCHDF